MFVFGAAVACGASVVSMFSFDSGTFLASGGFIFSVVSVFLNKLQYYIKYIVSKMRRIKTTVGNNKHRKVNNLLYGLQKILQFLFLSGN